MAIPDTNTFTLDNVIQEFGLGTGDGLQECFDDSSSGDFDSTHNPNSAGSSNNLLNFRNYGGSISTGLTGVLDTEAISSSTSWSMYSLDLAAYIGYEVKVVIEYTSGSSFRGDIQFAGNPNDGGLIRFGNRTYDPGGLNIGNWQTSRASTPAYANVVFFDIPQNSSTTNSCRYNRRNTTPPSGGTGLSPSATGGPGVNKYFWYAETSGGNPPGNPSKKFWLRSTETDIVAGTNTQFLKINFGSLGSNLGPNFKVYLDVIGPSGQQIQQPIFRPRPR